MHSLHEKTGTGMPHDMLELYAVSAKSWRRQGSVRVFANGGKKGAVVMNMEWINIRDKWPDDENEILVCTISKKGVRNVDKGYALGDRIVHRRTAQVTHWMPLPDMPNEN